MWYDFEMDLHLSTYLSTAVWGYSNEGAPDLLNIPVANIPVAWTGATEYKVLGYGSYDPLTGRYTVKREGFYAIDFDADFDVAQDAGFQTVGVQVNQVPAFHNGIFRTHPAGVAGRYNVAGRGLTLALSAGTTIAFSFATAIDPDTLTIYSASIRVQNVQAQLGTAL
jgi:hypothetical protein